MHVIRHTSNRVSISSHCTNGTPYEAKNTWKMFCLHRTSCTFNVKNDMQAYID